MLIFMEDIKKGAESLQIPLLFNQLIITKTNTMQYYIIILNIVSFL